MPTPVHPASDLCSPGVRALFQPARPAYYRGQDEGRQTVHHGPAPVQYSQHVGLLDAQLSRHRSCRTARHTKIILDESLYNRDYLRTGSTGTNTWKPIRTRKKPLRTSSIPCGRSTFSIRPSLPRRRAVKADMIVEVARLIGEAGTRFATHNWRSASSGNLGGWTVSRALHFLNVLTGSVGTPGGTSPNTWNKFHPKFFDKPPAQKFWNELHFPNEYPLAFFEMSFLLPHMLKENRGKMDVYFTRVFNPVWTYPDGFSWIEALSDEDKFGMHIALTPTWNETALFRRLRPAHGPLPANATTSTPTRRTPAFGSLSGNRCCARRCAAPARKWSSPTIPTRVRVGRRRILDTAQLAHGSRRQPGHPQTLRIALPPR